MASRTPLQNGLFALAGLVGARLLGLAFFARFARVEGPELYGAYGLGIAVSALFSVVIEPGLNALLTRDGARDHSRLGALAELSLGYKLAALAVVWPLMIATGAALGYRDTTLWAVALAGGTMLLASIEDHAAAILIAQERNDLESALRLTSKLLSAVLGLGALALGVGFEGVLASLVVAQVVADILGLRLASGTGVPSHPRLDWARARKRIHEGWPLAATGVLWLLTLRLDQLIASLLGVPQADLGDYNGAVKIVEALVLFPTAVVVTFQPVLAKAWVVGRERCSAELELALSAALGLTLPVAVGGAWLAQPLSVLVYGDAFAPVGRLLAVQLGGLLTVAVQFSCFPALLAAGALKQQTRLVAVNLGINLVLNLMLVPQLGVLGASLAAVGGGVAAGAACLSQVRALGLAVRPLRAAWRPLAATALMCAALAGGAARLPFVLAVGIGAVVYGVAYLGLGGGAVVAALRARRAGAADLTALP